MKKNLLNNTVCHSENNGGNGTSTANITKAVAPKKNAMKLGLTAGCM
jgi:hypothetical protein